MSRPVSAAGTVWPAACGAMDELGARIGASWDARDDLSVDDGEARAVAGETLELLE